MVTCECQQPAGQRVAVDLAFGPQPSDRTLQFLRVNGLSEDVGGDPRRLLDKVQAIIEREPSADKIYTFAELSYLAACKAEKQDRQLALDLYGASVVHAYQYLFDRRFRYLRNPYDPHFRSACDLYNSALEAGLRIVCKRRPGSGKTYTIQTASGSGTSAARSEATGGGRRILAALSSSRITRSAGSRTITGTMAWACR